MINPGVQYNQVKLLQLPVISSALYSTSIFENCNDHVYLLFNHVWMCRCCTDSIIGEASNDVELQY